MVRLEEMFHLTAESFSQTLKFSSSCQKKLIVLALRPRGHADDRKDGPLVIGSDCRLRGAIFQRFLEWFFFFFFALLLPSYRLFFFLLFSLSQNLQGHPVRYIGES